ncbi:MAG: type II secretion system F family protein [Deltaproteobacteria bacterium]|nr:type II secretion system F family protein [Deltaproteobacteria bacterium]
MPFYSYKAINADGGVIKGSMEGADIDTVRDAVSSAGLYVINLKKANYYYSSLHKLILVRSVRRTEVIEFANNLAVMLKAGMPMLTAHSDIAKTVENAYLRQTINNMRRMIELGSGFSEAAEAQGVFPDIFVRVTRVGEETGSLEKSLLDVASHLRKMEELSAALKRALIYPAFAVVSTFGALLFWLVYVLPKIMDIFKDMGMALPLPTRILLAVSGFSQSNWYLFIIVPALSVFLLHYLKKRKGKAAYYIDLAKIKAPVFKHIVYNRLLALFCEQMRILNTAGIPIDKSLRIISEVIGNEVFRAAIDRIREEIALGSRISDSLARQKVFSLLVTRMVDIGEASGSLDEQFEYLSGHYLAKLDDISQKISKMVEPIVIGVIGAMFALIILGLLLPIYDLVSKVGS